MRDVPAAMETTWRSGQYIGDRRPMARVTLQRPRMKLHDISFPAHAEGQVATGVTPTGTPVMPPTTDTKTHTIQETYADFLFGTGSTIPKELPNVQNVQWTRSLDSDVAQATITFYNTAPLPLGQTPTRDLDLRGYYTYNRGQSSYANRWGQTQNEWAGLLMPDNLLRTYEGYGFDPDLAPERDPNLVLTGVWMIDAVDYSTDGLISVTCRDLGRLLLDQIIFPPITPKDFYPLKFSKVDHVSGFVPEKTYITYVSVDNGVATPQDTIAGQPYSPIDQPTVNGKPLDPTQYKLRYHKSSNYHWDEDDTSQPSFNYTVKTGDWLIKLAARFDVSGGWRAIYKLNKTKIDTVAEAHGKPGGGHWIFPGEVLRIPGHGTGKGTDHSDSTGHLGKYAFDDDQHSYWLSNGHPKPSRAEDFEWIEGTLDNKTVTQVKFNLVGDGYTVYLSLWNGKRWVTGTGIKATAVPYRASSKATDIKANIPYIKKTAARTTSGYTITLDQPVPNVKLVRLTFHNLQQYAPKKDYRVGVQYVRAYGYAKTAALKIDRKGPNVAAPEQRPVVPLSPFIKGIGDDFNKARNLKSLGRASQTADLWTYKDDGAGKGAYWYRPTTPTNDGRAQRKGGAEGGRRYLWAINNLQYRHQRMDGKLRGQDLKESDNPTWALAARFRERDTRIDHIEATATRRGFIQLNLVRNGVRTQVGAYQMPGPPSLIDLADGTWRLRLSVTDQTASVWILPDERTTFGTPQIKVTDARFDDENMGYHLGMSSNSHKASWASFNAYGNVKGGVFDSFARPAEAGSLGRTETGQAWRQGGEAATPTQIKRADYWFVSAQMARRISHFQSAHRPTGRLWALANLGSITQLVKVRAYPETATGDKWLIALRARDARNLLYVAITQAGRLEVHQVLNGVDTKVYDALVNPAGWHDTAAATNLEAQIIDTELSVSVNGTLIYRVDDPDTYGNPGFGSLVGFGSDANDVVYDVFDATVPGTSGGGAGNDDDPNTTLIQLETVVPAHIEPGAGAKPFTYEDYTDIIKLLCAWGGFYWPKGGVQFLSDGTTVPYEPGAEDPVLGREGVGRVWGDFEQTGTAGVSDLGTDLFDKKSLMDAISYVRDIIGFVFMIDETGAAVWRPPNIYGVGNNIAAYSTNPGRTTDMVEIDERLTLISLKASLNSKNVRENVFIGTADGKMGSTAAGWNPNPVGLRRVGGWTDQNFATAQECAVMADLITLRQLFSYRTDSVSIPGFPKIQIDDQIRVFERTAAEGFVHYVQGISSNLSLETGQYTYDLDTHWLGEVPFAKWLFDPAQLSAATQAYLAAIAAESDGDAYYELPRGTIPAALKTVSIVTDGNQLTRGTGAASGADWGETMSKALLAGTTAHVTVKNVAGGNITTPQLTARAVATVDALYKATNSLNIAMLWEGSYHIASSLADNSYDAAVKTAQVRVTAANKVITGYNNQISNAINAVKVATTIRDQADADYLDYKRRLAIAEQALANTAPNQDDPSYQYLAAQVAIYKAGRDEAAKRRDDAQHVIDVNTPVTLLAKSHAYKVAADEVTAANAALKTAQAAALDADVDQTDVLNAYKAWATARKAKGFKVIVGTILPRRDTAWTAGQAQQFESVRLLANNLLRTHYKEFADALFDPAGDAAFTKANPTKDATTYTSNGVYLTAKGQALVAKYAAIAVLSITGG